MENEIEKINPLLCDPEEGVCGIPSDNDARIYKGNGRSDKQIKVIYFTDPICSSCWGIEPQLRKLKIEYGESLDIEYRMGGLLPDWSYNSGGISKPSDVAQHWDEVSLRYDMPIDGDVWLEDPLHSSYPPSIAFKAAQLQDEHKAVLFLRTLREMVFLEKKNITKTEHLEHAAEMAGLNVDQFKADVEGKGREMFEADLQFAHEAGVRSFPTLFFFDHAGHKETVSGTKPYAVFEQAVLKLNPAAEKKQYSKDANTLFSYYQSLTAREFTELSGVPRGESEAILDGLAGEASLRKLTTKNGSLWRLSI